MNSFLTHIPQTGQGTGSQLSARHGGRGLGEEEGLYIFLTPNQFHACAGLLPLLRPCTGPKVVEPAGRECGHHRKDEGGAHELTGNAMYPVFHERRLPVLQFLYARLPQPVLELLGREAGERIGLAGLAVDGHSGEQRDLAHGKALDFLQRQVHVRFAGHHADLEARSLVGDEDVALEGLFRQALLLIKGHLTAADHRLAGVQVQFRHGVVLLSNVVLHVNIYNRVRRVLQPPEVYAVELVEKCVVRLLLNLLLRVQGDDFRTGILHIEHSGIGTPRHGLKGKMGLHTAVLPDNIIAL